jgi:single-strand DNA-binding protein
MSVNKVILIGNVGKDPEVRYLDNNVAVANLTLATTERGFTQSNGTVVPDRTEWHNIVLWRGLAEIAEKYVRKGSQIYIEGRIRTRTWDDKEGNKRYTTEIYADNLQLLGKRNDSTQNTDNQSGSEPKAQQATNATFAAENDAADDLPF